MPSRIFYGRSHVHHQAIITTHGKEAAHSLKLSPNGRFLAVGNDEGLLEIYMLRGSVWSRFSIYESGTSIRALAWHPSENSTIFCGSANGSLHRITMRLDGSYDASSAVIPGYIHSLQVSPDGTRLAIGHGRHLSIVKDPFMDPNELGEMARLNVPLVENVQSLSEYRLARGIFFASSRTIIVPFLGKGGIIAYSLDNFSRKWSIQLQNNTFSSLGSAAISPSGKRVAVMNLCDGIDFYSTTHRRLLSTTHYVLSSRNPPRNLIVDIIFVDEDTVAFGHSDGYVALATFGVGQICGTFALNGDNHRAPVQAITFGLVNRQPFIFAVIPAFSPWMRTHGALPNNIHVGLIQNDDKSGIGEIGSTLDNPSTEIRPLSMYSASTFHLSTIQVAMLIIITISSTLYGKYWLSENSRFPSPDLQVTVTVDSASSASETSINPSSRALPMEALPTSPVHPFYAFTLTGMVTGSASIALPAAESDSA